MHTHNYPYIHDGVTVINDYNRFNLVGLSKIENCVMLSLPVSIQVLHL